jgi:hypothetical protein
VAKELTNLPEKNLPPPSASFRLNADFTVKAETVRMYLQRPEVTPQERDLLFLILTTPEALNRMCRLAIVSDFEAFLWDRHFDGKFIGPNPTDILDALLPYLPEELKAWWMESRRANYDDFSARMDEIFQEFRSSLTHTMIEDRSTGEPISLECRSKRS